MKLGPGLLNKKLIFISLLLVLLLIPAVLSEIDINTYTYSTDFYIETPQEVNVCACGFATERILIRNTGSYTSRFYLETDKEVLSFPANQYEIEPGQEYSIPFTVVADCDFTDEYVNVGVTNTFDEHKEFTIKIQGNKCQNLASKLTYDKDTVNPCETVHFKIDVENIGTFNDTYVYDFGKFNKYINYDHKAVKLPPGKVGTFNVNLTLPCEMTGNYAVPTTVQTLGSDYMLTFISNITVEDNYDFDITFLENLSVCADDYSTLHLLINNKNNFSNTFYIKSLGSDFISLENNQFRVEPNQEVKIPFNIEGSKDLIGNHNLSFEVTSKYGNVNKIVNSELYMTNCYDLSVYAEDVSACRPDLYRILVHIKNNAEVSQQVYLEFPYWGGTFSLEETEFELDPDEEKTVMINVSKVPDTDKYYNLAVNAYISGRDVKYSNDIDVDITSSYNCEKSIIEPNTIKINYDDNNESFSIKNIGSKDLWYNITITPYNQTRSSWIDIDYPNIVKLDSNQQENIDVSFDSTIYSQEEGNYYYNVKIIPMYTPLSDNTYDYELKVELRDKSFLYYTGVWVVNNLLLVFIIIIALLLLILLLYLFISRPKNLKHKKKRKNKAKKIFWSWLILTIIALILLLIFCPFKALYPEQDNNPNDLNITMYSGEDYVLDLNNYFTDPDDDVLDYYAEVRTIGNNSLDGYKISFQKSLVNIHAYDNVSGKMPVWFYATDNLETVKSDMFLVKVVKKPEYSFSDILDYYSYYIIWLVVVLFLFIFVLATLCWANKKTVRQYQIYKKK